MFTSSYYQYRGAGRIGISRGMPRGVPAGFRRYMPLAPGSWLWETDEEQAYREKYAAQLAQLNPTRVLADLQRLAGSAEPVILCFCNLSRPGAWCHRRFVAEWITDKTGLTVVERSPSAIRTTANVAQLLVN